MALTQEERDFLKSIYRELKDEPLQPGDPLYQPIYNAPGCEDPVDLLQKHIEWNDVESLQMFYGFRGAGKTTELFRFKELLEQQNFVVLYADALDYIAIHPKKST